MNNNTVGYTIKLETLLENAQPDTRPVSDFITKSNAELLARIDLVPNDTLRSFVYFGQYEMAVAARAELKRRTGAEF